MKMQTIQHDLFGRPVPIHREISGNQGQQANHSGNTIEDMIYRALNGKGYKVERQVVVGEGIYPGKIKRVDFFIEGIRQFPGGLIIESKWQETAGSVEEKFPYLVENIKKRYPVPSIVVYGGGGITDGAAYWLKKQVDGNMLYAVFTLEEFMKWIIRSL